jgi:hypothetical protein
MYEGAKRSLIAYLRQPDDQIVTMVEVTADKFPESMKTLVRDELLFLLDNKDLRPDLFGEIGPDCTQVYGTSKFILTAEVKPGPITITDVFQAKKYGEVYSAPVALLMSPTLPTQRILRLLELRPDLLAYGGAYQRLYLCRYSEHNESIDWWFEKREPRKK